MTTRQYHQHQQVHLRVLDVHRFGSFILHHAHVALFGMRAGLQLSNNVLSIVSRTRDVLLSSGGGTNTAAAGCTGISGIQDGMKMFTLQHLYLTGSVTVHQVLP